MLQTWGTASASYLLLTPFLSDCHWQSSWCSSRPSLSLVSQPPSLTSSDVLPANLTEIQTPERIDSRQTHTEEQLSDSLCKQSLLKRSSFVSIYWMQTQPPSHCQTYMHRTKDHTVKPLHSETLPNFRKTLLELYYLHSIIPYAVSKARGIGFIHWKAKESWDDVEANYHHFEAHILHVLLNFTKSLTRVWAFP